MQYLPESGSKDGVDAFPIETLNKLGVGRHVRFEHFQFRFGHFRTLSVINHRSADRWPWWYYCSGIQNSETLHEVGLHSNEWDHKHNANVQKTVHYSAHIHLLLFTWKYLSFSYVTHQSFVPLNVQFAKLYIFCHLSRPNMRTHAYQTT